MRALLKYEKYIKEIPMTSHLLRTSSVFFVQRIFLNNANRFRVSLSFSVSFPIYLSLCRRALFDFVRRSFHLTIVFDQLSIFKVAGRNHADFHLNIHDLASP